MIEIEQLFKHNEDLNYLLKRKMSFMLRFGMSFLFIIGLIVLISLYFIKVPDTLEGRFTLTSSNPPKSMLAKVNGRIIAKLAEDKSNIKEGQTIILMESIARPDEIALLEQELMPVQHLLDSNWLDSIHTINSSAYQQLGEIQEVYESYKKSNNELCMALANGQFKQEKKIIERRLIHLIETRTNLIKQKAIHDREYTLANEAWQMDSILNEQRSITQTELRAAESSKLQRKLRLSEIQQSIITNETAINDIEKQLLDLDKTIAQQKNSFIQNYSLLKTSLSEWKTKYLIIAPFSGTISYNRNIYNGLQVQAGESLFFILPEGSNWIAEMFVPQKNFGKLHVGQRTILKFDSYNYEEFGAMEGIVNTVSNIPQELKTEEGVQNAYMLQITLDNNLVTNYNKTISPRFGLSGIANIALDDKSLLEKLFLDKFRALFVYQ